MWLFMNVTAAGWAIAQVSQWHTAIKVIWRGFTHFLSHNDTISAAQNVLNIFAVLLVDTVVGFQVGTVKKRNNGLAFW